MASRNDQSSSPVLTLREVAQLLNVHVNTARRWGDSGVIRAYRVGPRGDRRFSREDVVSILKRKN